MDDIPGPVGRPSELSPDDLDRIERYVAGALSPGEADAFREWLGADSRRHFLVDALRQLWAGEGVDRPAFDISAMWARTVPRVRERRRVLTLTRRTPRPACAPRFLTSFKAAAALVVVAAGIAAGAAIARSRQRAVPAALASRDFSTRRGQRADLQLDDGTQLVLAAATTVRIPDDYGDKTRDVYLDGEAYFAVKHDSTRPFTVHAGHAVVHDIGTRFAITAYDSTASTRIVVADGEVGVDRVRLRPNDLAIIDSTGHAAVVRHGVDATSATAWTQGRLVFQELPFREIAASLTRWYDIDIEIADSTLGNQLLTVTFASESTHQVLDALAMLTHSRYEQHGRRATFFASPGL